MLDRASAMASGYTLSLHDALPSSPVRVGGLVVVTTRALPLAAATLPPLIRADDVRFHEPGSGAARARKSAPGTWLSSVSASSIVPPVRVNVPSPRVVTPPPTLIAH